jgi:hypothetical protein
MRGLSLPFLGILGAVEAFISDNADLPAFCQQPKQNNQRSRSLSTPAVRDFFINNFFVCYEKNPHYNLIDCIIVITADG